MSDVADKRIAELERELLGTQEMLALVLAVVDEPVTVTKDFMKNGLAKGAQIQVDDTGDAFVFSIEKVVTV